MSYPKWCAMLVSMTLKTRTSFSAFLSKSILLLRGPMPLGSSTPTLFPVPAFDRGQFHRMPSGASSTKRARIHLQRAVHVVCMALNFWHSGGRWIPDEALRRRPNPEHIALYDRIASLIKSDGLADSFSLEKHPELIGRLSELSDLLVAQGGHASYDRAYPGVQPVDTTPLADIAPYADLNASRLRL
eukprot:s1879_g16.t1